jgi:hypothetical protein
MKAMRKIRRALMEQGALGEAPMMSDAQNQLSQWMNYDPTLNPVTGTGSITGSGMGAILDALARDSYQNVEAAINKQANVGREAAFDELSRRGIVTSSEAPAAMSVLEGQRLDQIRNAAQNIEAQRLQGQLAIPGMLQQMGNFGASAQQRLFDNTMARFSMRNQMKQIEQMKKARKAQEDAAGMAAYGQLGQAIGTGVGYLAGGPLGAALGGQLGNMAGDYFSGGNNPNADLKGYQDPRSYDDYSYY